MAVNYKGKSFMEQAPGFHFWQSILSNRFNRLQRVANPIKNVQQKFTLAAF